MRDEQFNPKSQCTVSVIPQTVTICVTLCTDLHILNIVSDPLLWPGGSSIAESFQNKTVYDLNSWPYQQFPWIHNDTILVKSPNEYRRQASLQKYFLVLSLGFLGHFMSLSFLLTQLLSKKNYLKDKCTLDSRYVTLSLINILLLYFIFTKIIPPHHHLFG